MERPSARAVVKRASPASFGGIKKKRKSLFWLSARVAVTRLELGRHREEENNREKSPHTQQTHVIMRRLALRLRNNSL